MRKLAFLLLLVFSACALRAEQPESLDSLKARAAAAEGKKRVELLVKIAQRQLQAADDLYAAGQSEPAQLALQDVADYGVQACQAAGETRKRMKETEIAVRKIGNRLQEIRRGVAFDDRPPLIAAIEKLEKARSELLHRMFKK